MDPVSNILSSLFSDEVLQSVEFELVAWFVTLRIMENNLSVVIRGNSMSYVGSARSFVFDFLVWQR